MFFSGLKLLKSPGLEIEKMEKRNLRREIAAKLPREIDKSGSNFDF